MASRSIALRGICELWSHGHSFEEFHQNLKCHLESNAKELQHYFMKDKTFKISVEMYNKHLKQVEKIQKIESLHYLPIEGNADLRNPKVKWWYIEFWGLDPLKVPASPENILFGRWVNNSTQTLSKFINLCLEDMRMEIHYKFSSFT